MILSYPESVRITLRRYHNPERFIAHIQNSKKYVQVEGLIENEELMVFDRLWDKSKTEILSLASP